jgi:hypothetical protein
VVLAFKLATQSLGSANVSGGLTVWPKSKIVPDYQTKYLGYCAKDRESEGITKHKSPFATY